MKSKNKYSNLKDSEKISDKHLLLPCHQSLKSEI